METFKQYAKYYDAIYGQKEYAKEVAFLETVIKKYSPRKVNSLLSLGCGTATHDIALAKKGFFITGIDASKEMIAIAKQKARAENVGMELLVADVTTFSLPQKYDAVMALFNIVGYMAQNNDMEKMLANASASLKKNGLFVFDGWYGPAVLKDRPQNRQKEFVKDGKDVKRITTQQLDIEKSTLDITFEILEKRQGQWHHITTETHKTRFWYLPELEYFLSKAGLSLIKACLWMDDNATVSENAWDLFVIAKKIW